ncbi:MAG: hypothetical protein LAP86_29970 [Acidobacteriia bacterium]|nr:hypothetical protein [Terriglobia bacterium]
MADPLADRLKKLAAQKEQGVRAEKNAIEFQQRVNNFISDNARPEYDRLLALLQKRIDAVNPALGDLPKFVYQPNQQVVEQGNAAAYLYFDKPILNAPDNRLLLSFGPHRAAIYVGFVEQPAAIRYSLHAAASDALDRIVWVGDLGEITSEKLVELILEQLTTYYFGL